MNLKKTSHTTKFHKRRKAIPGLTPASLVAQMQEVASGKEVRGVRGRNQQRESVLPGARETETDSAGTPGIFGEPSGSGSEDTAVSDSAGNSNSEASFRTQLSRVLKKMLGDAAPHVEGMGRLSTNAEALAAVIQREALGGKQWACEFWRDMAEGKPVRAAQQNNNEHEIESNLDRVSLAALNRLTERKADNV